MDRKKFEDDIVWSTDDDAPPPWEDPLYGLGDPPVVTFAEAVCKGHLIDISPLAAECGFPYSFFVTSAFWENPAICRSEDSVREFFKRANQLQNYIDRGITNLTYSLGPIINGVYIIGYFRIQITAEFGVVVQLGLPGDKSWLVIERTKREWPDLEM